MPQKSAKDVEATVGAKIHVLEFHGGGFFLEYCL